MPLSHPTLFTIHAAFTEQLSAVGLHAAGTSCKRGHPHFIEKVRMVEVHSVKQSQGQVGPGCFRRWCPAHKEFKRHEPR
jgi:hypothetical protein